MTRVSLLGRPSARTGSAQRLRQTRFWLLLYGCAAAGTLLPLLILWRFRFLLGFGVAAAAFLGLRARAPRLDPRRLGWTEAALSTSFVILLVGAYWLHAFAG